MKLEQVAPFQYRLNGSVGTDLAADVQAEVAAVLRRPLESDESDGSDQADVFDLSGVVDGNSVTIALMMGWLREAAKQERQISFQGVPETLIELIEFYGLDGVLPLQADGTAANTGAASADEPGAQGRVD